VVEFDIMYGTGISKSGVILDTAVEMDIVDKAGSWFSYDGEKLGQGRENVKTYLEENRDIMNEIEGKIRSTLRSEEEDGDLFEDEKDGQQSLDTE